MSETVWLDPLDLKPWAKNPRKNDGRPVEKTIASIKRFGFVNPIVVWKTDGRIVAGHTRLKAMKEIIHADPTFAAKGAPGPGLVRVLFHEFENEAEANAFALADNRIGEEAEWDDEGVAQILLDIKAQGHDIAGIGFDSFEVADLMKSQIELDIGAPRADREEGLEPIAFRAFKVQMSTHTAERFEQAILKYIEDRGTTAGFVEHVLECLS